MHRHMAAKADEGGPIKLPKTREVGPKRGGILVLHLESDEFLQWLDVAMALTSENKESNTRALPSASPSAEGGHQQEEEDDRPQRTEQNGAEETSNVSAEYPQH